MRAIASTVCHDHHNIAVVGADYADMALAANRLGEIEGGFVVVEEESSVDRAIHLKVRHWES